MLVRSLSGRSSTPNYDSTNESSFFIIKVHHGGLFVRSSTRGYIGRKEMKMNSLSTSDTEAHSDDFDDSDYSLEEEDLLFLKNVDPSAEFFGINMDAEKKKNDRNQNYVSEGMQSKMQNEESDSDCVDFDDTESLNSNCNSEFED